MAYVESLQFANSDPFDIPYEHPSGVQLNFNFWARRTFLETEKDILALITGLLTDSEVPCIKKEGSSNKKEGSSKVILTILQSTDSSIITSEAIRTSSFFKECSSVPINQQRLSDMKIKNIRTLPTDSVYSTLLWPEKPSEPFEKMKYFHSSKLFEQFNLKFQVKISK